MPNWCENRLTITGDRREIDRFRVEVKTRKTDLSLSKLYPMPKELEDTQSPSEKPDKALIEKYGTDNWYDWRVKNWGTKWDVWDASLVEKGDDYLEYHFFSAWSPPVEWLKNVSEDYPKLSFLLKYQVENMGTMGVARAENGKVNDQCIGY